MLLGRLYYISIYFFSLLPLPFLYLWFRILGFFLFDIFHYRRKVVKNNMLRAFPNWTSHDQKRHQKAFEQHFTRLLAESVKAFSISQKQLARRIYFKDLSLFERFARDGQAFLVAMGHFGNWEWGGLAMSHFGPQQLYAVYKAQKGPINKLLIDLRERFGAKTIESESVFPFLSKAVKQEGNSFCLTLINDQSPSPKRAHWVPFFEVETPTLKGISFLALRYDLPVVYAEVNQTKPGYYEIELKLLREKSEQMESEVLTALHTAELEKSIRKQPSTWLWSHKRWKHVDWRSHQN